jgi:hypothetical protein
MVWIGRKPCYKFFMSKKKTMVTGDLVKSNWVAEHPQLSDPKARTPEEIRRENLREKKKRKDKRK